jgi:hypothetical protein
VQQFNRFPTPKKIHHDRRAALAYRSNMKALTCSRRSLTYAAKDRRKDSMAALSTFQLASMRLQDVLVTLSKTGP